MPSKELECLAQKNELLAAAIETTTTAISISDPDIPDNPLIYCNHAFCTISGYSKKEAVGQSNNFLQGSDTDQTTIAEINAAIRSKSTITTEILHYRKNGTPFWSRLTVSPVFDARDGLINFVSTHQDITELKAAKNDSLQLKRELRQSQKMEALGSLAGGIAHEINTPIQYIGDNLQFIREATESLMAIVDTHCQLLDQLEAKEEFAELISNSQKEYEQKDVKFLREELPLAAEQSIEGVKQVANIVSAMKEFTHPTRKEMSPVDLNRVVERSVTVCRSEWKYIAELEFAFDEKLPKIIADEGALNQVVLNLIVNAAHAIEQRGTGMGRITFRTEQADDKICLSIEDTGIGIPENIKQQIFEPFFTTKEAGHGTGQGLALVREVVVERHSGQIDVKSIVGKGTTILIELPIQSQEIEVV
tara:strand:- start:364 stop:1623 length:1260 start_codon:yes stop_codon:yes gene_type:complete